MHVINGFNKAAVIIDFVGFCPYPGGYGAEDVRQNGNLI